MGFGAGMGLPNIKRNTDKMHIESVVNKGTTLNFVNYLSKTT
jgi:anti-sigma regulatory factor (Ser/Thr protein kinase)